MKKVLLATTVLVGTAGFAAAEGLTVTGSGVFGLNYAENAPLGADRTTTLMETYIAFAGAGETDSGLSFGMSSTLGQFATLAPAYADDGTTLFISGSFGKVTFGDVSEADEVAGLGDIGLTGIGVDDVAEITTGDSSGGIAHDVNYSYSAGDFSVSLSGRIGASDPVNSNDSFAVGTKYTFGDYYVGLGYNDTDVVNLIAGPRDGATTSVYAGGSAGDVSIKAMYAAFSPDLATARSVKSYGVNVDYKAGAATVSFAFADNDTVLNTKASYGIGVSYDLGGGASVVGGIGSVNDVTRAQAGVSLTF